MDLPLPNTQLRERVYIISSHTFTMYNNTTMTTVSTDQNTILLLYNKIIILSRARDYKNFCIKVNIIFFLK